VAQKISEICEICGGILLNTLCSTIVEYPLQIDFFVQNKAKVNIGKMTISIARIKDYDKNNEQSTTTVIQNKANRRFLAGCFLIDFSTSPLCFLAKARTGASVEMTKLLMNSLCSL
jgi:hypothetical protein